MSMQANPPRAWRSSLVCLTLMLGVALGCKQLSKLPGAKANNFEGTNAQDAAAKIKQKIGAPTVKVSRMEIHSDEFEMVIQAPNNPKNFDKYTFKNGVVTGPEPQEAMVIGNNELTADKMPLFELNEVNLAAMPDVCRQAGARAQIEQGKCDLISIDWEYAEHTRSKEEKAKREAEQQKLGPIERMKKRTNFYRDLAVTWRIWIKGPRMTKYFWADAKENLAEGGG
jgi:hypothetical protein